MDKGQIESFLANNVPIKYDRIRGSRLAAKVTNRLIAKEIEVIPTETTCHEVEIKRSVSCQDLYLRVKNTLISTGKVLEEDEVNRVITGLVYAGAANVNPVILVVDIKQNNLKISAYAKEGLIKQHTGETAIENFMKAL